MKKALIIIAVIGLCFLISGGIVFTVVMSKNGWNFGVMNNAVLEAKTYSVEASEINSVSIETGTMRIRYVEATDNKITVDYCNVFTKEGKVVSEFNIAVSSGILRVSEESKPAWFINYGDAEVVVKVPAGKEVPIDLQSGTGRIVLGETGKEIKAPSVTLNAGTGRIEVNAKVSCAGEFFAETSTGRVVLKGDIVCGGDLTARSDTGRVECEGAIEAKNVTLRASTGRVVVSAPLKTNKLRINSSTGDVECRSPIEANDINVEVSTGDVYLTVKGVREQYSFSGSTSTGKSNLSSYDAGEKPIRVKTSTGDIEVYFKE